MEVKRYHHQHACLHRGFQLSSQTLRHHPNLTIKGIHSAYCMGRGENCNMHLSEPANKGPRGKGFPFDSQSTTQKAWASQINQFPL